MRYAVILTVFFIGAMPKAGLAADNETRVRDAVDRGLKYLASQQQKSGAWSLQSRGDSPGVTSLAVMAFISAGHVPGEGPYGKQLDRAIDWVLKQYVFIETEKGNSSKQKRGRRQFFSSRKATVACTNTAFAQ